MSDKRCFNKGLEGVKEEKYHRDWDICNDKWLCLLDRWISFECLSRGKCDYLGELVSDRVFRCEADDEVVWVMYEVNGGEWEGRKEGISDWREGNIIERDRDRRREGYRDINRKETKMQEAVSR